MLEGDGLRSCRFGGITVASVRNVSSQESPVLMVGEVPARVSANKHFLRREGVARRRDPNLVPTSNEQAWHFARDQVCSTLITQTTRFCLPELRTRPCLLDPFTFLACQSKRQPLNIERLHFAASESERSGWCYFFPSRASCNLALCAASATAFIKSLAICGVETFPFKMDWKEASRP
jgi:hypothetical protein